MINIDMLDGILEEIGVCSFEDIPSSPKFWKSITERKTFYVKNFEEYTSIANKLYQENTHIQQRYSRKTFFSVLDNILLEKKKSSKKFIQDDVDNFISQFVDKEPLSLTIFSPISGISLNRLKPLLIGPYIIEEHAPEEMFSTPERCLHIGINISNIYDLEIAKNLALSHFNDFSRIVHFFLGTFDKNNIIKIGLPILPSSFGRTFIDIGSYSFVEDGKIFSTAMSNNYCETIPIDDSFFTNHKTLSGIWELEKIQHLNGKLSKMQKRLLVAAKAIGESAKSYDLKNSILYSCIAIEALFSFEEKSLFNRSIGDKIAEAISYMIGNDLESRLKIDKLVRDTYGIRSAISHGGDASLNDNYIILNQYTRKCIELFLNDSRFKNIQNIKEFYDFIKVLRYS